jgi:hypothetical protein
MVRGEGMCPYKYSQEAQQSQDTPQQVMPVGQHTVRHNHRENNQGYSIELAALHGVGDEGLCW